LKCHKFAGTGGEVGPDLAGIGGKQTREYILEGIVLPNKTIAPGFENVLVTTRSGIPYAGTLKSETETEMVINSPEDGPLTIKKADIAKRERGPSAMPEGVHSLITRQEIRDLVEFLSTSK
jgi:quinoprotein glucose dehydrogenase